MGTSKKSPVSKPTAVSLLLTAVAESIWVLPCFIQCVLVFFKGHGGDWAPDLNSEGCDIQGYYSFAAAQDRARLVRRGAGDRSLHRRIPAHAHRTLRLPRRRLLLRRLSSHGHHHPDDDHN